MGKITIKSNPGGTIVVDPKDVKKEKPEKDSKEKDKEKEG